MRWHSFFICLFLTVSTLSVYHQVRDFEFVNLDDSVYVSDNEHVTQGLSFKNIRWALTAEVAANWHPLTIISHMLDCGLYGLNPGHHHLTSLFFHIANSLLLFLVLKRMTGALWQCAFVAALFALHPLHVESVAWVSERKDVLSTFFMMLALWAYARYVERPGVKTYIPVAVFFVLGLMSKPMLVTLPFVLLLLDLWPLNRLQFEKTIGPAYTQEALSLSRLVFEKIPLFALSAASCIVTYLYQQSGGSVVSVFTYPLYKRVVNAFVSYIHYLLKMIWPFKLAAFYPNLDSIPLWQACGAIALFALITFFALRSYKRYPLIFVGWFWYVGTLMPVIGLVQVGEQAMADRYTYIPLIGIFIMIAWGVPELLTRFKFKTKLLAALSSIIILVLIPITWLQVGVWANSISLFKHAIKVTDKNYFALNNLAFPLVNQGRIDEAIIHLKEALKIYPGYAKAHYNLGVLLERKGKAENAIRQYLLALRTDPSSKGTHTALGSVLATQGNYEKAIEHLNKGFDDPVKALLRMGDVLFSSGHEIEAAHYYALLLEKDPDSLHAHYSLGSIFAKQGDLKKAEVHFKEAIRIDNNFAEGHTNLGYVMLQQGNEDEGIRNFYEAIRIDPEKSINAYYNLAWSYWSPFCL